MCPATCLRLRDNIPFFRRVTSGADRIRRRALTKDSSLSAVRLGGARDPLPEASALLILRVLAPRPAGAPTMAAHRERPSVTWPTANKAPKVYGTESYDRSSVSSLVCAPLRGLSNYIGSCTLHGVTPLIDSEGGGKGYHITHQIDGHLGLGSAFGKWRLITCWELRHRPSAEAIAFRATRDEHAPELQVRGGTLTFVQLEDMCLRAASEARDAAARGGENSATPPCIVMMRGPQGSGKSEASKELTRLLSGGGKDAVRIYRDNKEYTTEEQKDYALSDAVAKVGGVFGTGPVVYDSTASTYKLRRLVHDLAAKHKVSIFVVEIEVDLATCIERATDRTRKKRLLPEDWETIIGATARNLYETQPMKDDETEISSFQGYEDVFKVDGTPSEQSVKESLAGVAREIRTQLRSMALDSKDPFRGADKGILKDVPTADTAESPGKAHLDQALAASDGHFATENVPNIFQTEGLFATTTTDDLRARAAAALGIEDEDLMKVPAPLDPDMLRGVLGKVLDSMPDSKRRGSLNAWDHRALLQIAAPAGTRGAFDGFYSTALRDAFVAAADGQDVSESVKTNASKHLEWEALLRLAMPEVSMASGSYQDMAPGGRISAHNDKAAFDFRFIQQYAAPDATFVTRFEIVPPAVRRFPCPAGCGRTFIEQRYATRHGRTCTGAAAPVMPSF